MRGNLYRLPLPATVEHGVYPSNDSRASTPLGPCTKPWQVPPRLQPGLPDSRNQRLAITKKLAAQASLRYE